MHIKTFLPKCHFRILVMIFFIIAIGIGIFFINRTALRFPLQQQLERQPKQQTKQTPENQSGAALVSFNVSNGFFEATSNSLAYVEVRATQNNKPADDTNKDVWIADMIQEGEGDDRQHWKLAVATCFGPYHTIYAVGRDHYLKPVGVIELPAHDAALRDYVCGIIQEPKDWVTAKYFGYLDVPRWWPQIQITFKDGGSTMIGRLYGYRAFEPSAYGLDNKFGKGGDDIVAGGIVSRNFAATISDRVKDINNQHNQLCGQSDVWTSGRLTWTRLRCDGVDNRTITEYDLVKDPSLSWGTVELSFIASPPVLEKTYQRILQSFSFFRTKEVDNGYVKFVIPEDYSLASTGDSNTPTIILDQNGNKSGVTISVTIGSGTDGYLDDILTKAIAGGEKVEKTTVKTIGGGPVDGIIITHSNSQRELDAYQDHYYTNTGIAALYLHVTGENVVNPSVGSVFDIVIESLKIFEL